MIAKRAKFFGAPGHRKQHRIKTKNDLVGLLLYLTNRRHPNHKKVTVGDLQFWRAFDPQSWIVHVLAAAGIYEAMPNKIGRPWLGEVAEHVVYAPPPGCHLTESERDAIAAWILARIAPRSPAIYIWHIGKDGRDDLHILASNFDFPGLRVTELSHTGDYMHLLRHAGETAIASVNERRRKLGVVSVPTIPEIRSEKRRALKRISIAREIIGLVGLNNVDKNEVVQALRIRGWECRPTQRHISVTPPGKKKAYRWPWDVMMAHIENENALILAEWGLRYSRPKSKRPDPRRGFAAGRRAPQPDTPPERSESCSLQRPSGHPGAMS